MRDELHERAEKWAREHIARMSESEKARYALRVRYFRRRSSSSGT